MFQPKDHVKKCVDYMNTKHPNICFTFEIEDQNSCSFLNIKIIRNTELLKHQFIGKVYTFSGVFTNFKSFVTMTYKIELLETVIFLFFRMLTAARKELILVLPYFGQQLLEIRNRIQCCVKENGPVFNLKVVFQSKNNLLFTFKDKINKMLHSNLVYKLKWNICNYIYYGKSKHHFKVRACEHLGITPLTGKKVKSSKDRAVSDHIFHTGCNASFDDFETLVKESDELRLLLRKSLLILHDDPPLNRYVKSISLELFS